MLIYKIFRGPELAELAAQGETLGAPVDLTDGYVHFSTAAQAEETAAKYFAGMDGLWVLACDTDAMGDALRWEPSRGGQLFPHLYRALRVADVIWARPLPWAGDSHRWPDLK